MTNTFWSPSVEEEACAILSQLIQIPTITPDHREIEAVEYIKNLFDKEGIPSTVYTSAPGRGNLVATLKSSSAHPKEPMLILSHLDVVAADESKWTKPPFSGLRENGVIYGRGTIDTKQMTVMGMMALLLLKRNQVALDRDVLFIATADEEMGSTYGMQFLSEQHPECLPYGYVFNEGGGFVMDVGGKRFRTCACGEKGVCDLAVTLQPSPEAHPFFMENSVMTRFAKIAERVCAYKTEPILCNVTKRFLEIAGDSVEQDATLKNLYEYSMHNTMALTKFSAVHDCSQAEQPMTFTINFRFVPGVTKEQALATLEQVLEGTEATWEISRYFAPYESDIDSSFLQILDKHSKALEENSCILLPMLALGNTDGRFLRTNVYGYTPLLDDLPFSQVLKMVHGHNEQITEKSLLYGSKVLFYSILELGGASQ